MKRIFFCALLATSCHATDAELDQTAVDAVKDGACIAVALLSSGDPLTCAGATEQLVIDVANDVEAKQALTPEQKSRFDSERVLMAVKLAAKQGGK